MNLKKLWLKITDKKRYFEYKNFQIKKSTKLIYENKIKHYLENVDRTLRSNEEISFLHSGHLGDLINALPLTKRTKRVFNKKIFKNMKKNSIFISVSRDQTINIGDLKTFIKRRKFYRSYSLSSL